jgi:hypothetical protein
MKIGDDIRLPHVDKTPPNLALMILGKALADTYGEGIDGPMPERLRRVLRELEERESDNGEHMDAPA